MSLHREMPPYDCCQRQNIPATKCFWRQETPFGGFLFYSLTNSILLWAYDCIHFSLSGQLVVCLPTRCVQKKRQKWTSADVYVYVYVCLCLCYMPSWCADNTKPLCNGDNLIFLWDRSVLTYTPRSPADFGKMTCSGRNSHGEGKPCHFVLAKKGIAKGKVWDIGRPPLLG